MLEICNLRNEKPKHIYDIRVDRASILGNPFYMKTEKERDLVCNRYENYFRDKILNDAVFKNHLYTLLYLYKDQKKLRLFCWCSPKRCHAETIKNWILSKSEVFYGMFINDQI